MKKTILACLALACATSAHAHGNITPPKLRTTQQSAIMCTQILKKLKVSYSKLMFGDNLVTAITFPGQTVSLTAPFSAAELAARAAKLEAAGQRAEAQHLREDLAELESVHKLYCSLTLTDFDGTSR